MNRLDCCVCVNLIDLATWYFPSLWCTHTPDQLDLSIYLLRCVCVCVIVFCVYVWSCFCFFFFIQRGGYDMFDKGQSNEKNTLPLHSSVALHQYQVAFSTMNYEKQTNTATNRQRCTAQRFFCSFLCLFVCVCALVPANVCVRLVHGMPSTECFGLPPSIPRVYSISLPCLCQVNGGTKSARSTHADKHCLAVHWYDQHSYASAVHCFDAILTILLLLFSIE